jgi:hypothetical protein
MEKEPILICPHCYESIIIQEINCGIFRHGIIKNTGQQMDPHLNKQECDRLKKENLIFGCGKPFMIIENDGEYLIIDCDYI